MIRQVLFSLFTLLFFISPKNTDAQLQYVNPMIGTDGHGHTFPGATTPFGMVQLSPDSRQDDSWDGCSGYHYSDPVIYGFSHTHLSGTGVPDYCDILVQPYGGKMPSESRDYVTTYMKESQVAEAGYYSVFLDRPQTKAEMTATTRVGIHQYTFGSIWATDNLLVDLRHRDLVLDAEMTVVSPTEVVGKRVSSAWAKEQHVYFVMRFSRPMVDYTMSDDNGFLSKNAEKAKGKAVFGGFSFAKSNEPLVVKVALSATGIPGARANMDAEAAHFDFEKYKESAQQAWKNVLSKVSITGGTDEQLTTFYTALYHAYIAPNIYNDVTGAYRGRDQKIHQLSSDQKHYYTVFSLWDTYRALHPLLTILEPTICEDFIKTMLLQYEQGGRLPIWELAANETDCMIGNHAIPVIADAYLKGLRNYDAEKAIEAMLFSANQDRLGLKDYRNLGFLPSESESESVSKTLEYAFDDFAIAEMAKAMGKLDIASAFYHRSQNWRNLYNPSTGFLQARNNNTWHGPFDPAEVNFNYTEANAWQYRFAMPHDINSFIEKLGGDAAMEAALDSLFSADTETSGRQQADITGLVGQYAQGNEPSHHIAFLYNYIGKPYKTQELIYKIRAEQYGADPAGLCGNEDCGQMSAWLVFNAFGFYPVVPVGGEYVIGTPWFDRVTLQLENGKKFNIIGNRRSKADPYVSEVHLDTKKQLRSYIHHSDIMKGGNLTFLMGSKPNLTWGAAVDARPKAKVESKKAFVPLPFVASGARVFDKKQKITLACDAAESLIYYTTDGTLPNTNAKRYTKAFKIKKSSTVHAIAIMEGSSSAIMEAQFDRLNKNLKIHAYHCSYSNQYTARGDKGLVDGLRGGADFRSGGWQGFEGQDFDVVLDMGKKKKIVHKVGLSALQDENSWIFFPKNISVEVSNNGTTWQTIGTVKNQEPEDAKGTLLHDFNVHFSAPQKVRYVRIKAEALKKCPKWHKGAGHPCWAFVDEVWVE